MVVVTQVRHGHARVSPVEVTTLDRGLKHRAYKKRLRKLFFFFFFNLEDINQSDNLMAAYNYLIRGHQEDRDKLLGGTVW